MHYCGKFHFFIINHKWNRKSIQKINFLTLLGKNVKRKSIKNIIIIFNNIFLTKHPITLTL